MRRELQQRLIDSHPDLMGDETQRGFSCGDGWFELLDTLMDAIQFLVKFDKRPKVTILYVKEKFGGLTFHYKGGDEYVHGLVQMATHFSYKTCEFCGTNQNVGRTQGWISVCCKECHGKEERRKDLVWRPNVNQRFLKLLKIKDILDKNENKC